MYTYVAGWKRTVTFSIEIHWYFYRTHFLFWYFILRILHLYGSLVPSRRMRSSSRSESNFMVMNILYWRQDFWTHNGLWCRIELFQDFIPVSEAVFWYFHNSCQHVAVITPSLVGFRNRKLHRDSKTDTWKFLLWNFRFFGKIFECFYKQK